MAVMNPRSPVRADHRFIKKVVSTMLGGKVVEIPSEYTRISRVFSKAGGSWDRLFKGSVKDLMLLKKIIKVAFDKGHLTKQESW